MGSAAGKAPERVTEAPKPGMTGAGRRRASRMRHRARAYTPPLILPPKQGSLSSVGAVKGSVATVGNVYTFSDKMESFHRLSNLSSASNTSEGAPIPVQRMEKDSSGDGLECPNCHGTEFKKSFTCLGIFLGCFCFPCGIFCCLKLRKLTCTKCNKKLP